MVWFLNGDERTGMSGGWVLAIIAAVAVATVGTLCVALMLLREGLKSISAMCTSIVASLLGQPVDKNDGVVFESDVGQSTDLFETMRPWWMRSDSEDEDGDGNMLGVPK